jgi:hypothetical protein
MSAAFLSSHGGARFMFIACAGVRASAAGSRDDTIKLVPFLSQQRYASSSFDEYRIVIASVA